MTTEQPTQAPPEEAKTKSFLSAYTVLAIVTVGVWLLAFVIPSGQYRRSEDGRPVAGSYQEVPSPESFLQRVKDLFLAPVNGMYGIKGDDGFVSPDNTGELFGSVEIVMFVLAIGIFVTMMLATGALTEASGGWRIDWPAAAGC